MPSKKIQLGKAGLTESFIKNLKIQFENCNNIKVSVLKSICRDRNELKEISEKILKELGKNYTSKIIGYTFALKKWRKKILKRRND